VTDDSGHGRKSVTFTRNEWSHSTGIVGHVRPESVVTRARNTQYVQRGEVLPLERVHSLRQDEAKPVLEKFKTWVDDLLPGTPPNSALGKALGYTHRQWKQLARYVDHPDVPCHNNSVEQIIKHYATGRKCWFFCYDQVGAQASANLFSLAMTCRANDVDRFEYFSYLFEHPPMATTLEALEPLLPWNAKPILEERRKRREAALRAAAAN